MKNDTIRKIRKKAYSMTYIPIRNRRYINRECKPGRDFTLSHITHQLTGNSGDTVLSYCVRKTLAQNKKISWEIIPVREAVDERIITAINKTAGAIIGGGGLFLPDSNANSISGWQWQCPEELLDNIEVPIFLHSVGYNYFRGQSPSELFIHNLNCIVEKSAFIGLRNTGSINSVKSLIRPKLRDKVQFQPCTTTIIRKVIEGIPDKQRTNNVAINIAFDRLSMRLGDDYEKILGQIAEAMKQIELLGNNIFCVAHCSSDLAFCAYLEKAGVHFKAIDGEFWLPTKWLAFYNQMDTVLGMRGHSQMIPFGLNDKIITLGSHDKMRWFLEDIEATDWYIELSEGAYGLRERILEKYTEIACTNRKQVEERLLTQQDKLFSITCKNNDLINYLLFGGK